MSKKLVAVAAAAGIAMATVVLGPVSAASAAPVICEPGYKSAKWTQLSSTWVVTHAKQINIAQDSTGTFTKSAVYRTSVTAGREVTAGASYSASWVISSMDAHVSGTLSKSGEKTSERSESVTYNFNKPGTYVVFSGVKRASGYWTAKTCNSAGTAFGKEGAGKARSWNVQAEGAVKCTENPSAGTIKRSAKNGYC
ncbi:hypothetical protein [Streptomyces sp. NBC_00280]|uniref:hypothetical protein n=1 Tax=Streptomyces sp. NBC_00280 TaxID=2975699 RepID=UPI00324F3DD5